MEALVFIDTVIFLDFYRVIGREGGLSILNHLHGNHLRIITGNQIEMEYKNNRQRVVLDTYKQLVQIDKGRIQLPAFLAESKQALAITKKRNEANRLVEKLKYRVLRILRQPQRYDIVYKSAHRLFRANSPYNLTKDKKERFNIRRMGWKRFILGYPPRKAKDTTLGDAINWEWMIKCAKDSGKELVIVSRDSDYGEKLSKSLLLNDWLLQEFRERVSRKRKIVLTDRLTEGFKMAGIRVTRMEEREEQQFLEKQFTGLIKSGTLDKESTLILFNKIWRVISEGIKDENLIFTDIDKYTLERKEIREKDVVPPPDENGGNA